MKDENYWEKLALSRRLEIKVVKARLVEVTDGREKWKAKAMTAQAENKILKKNIEDIKKKLNQIDLL